MRGHGVRKYEKDYQWRWKGRKRISDCYDDVELPSVDAKETNVLCIGGACKYQVNENSGVNNTFLCPWYI